MNKCGSCEEEDEHNPKLVNVGLTKELTTCSMQHVARKQFGWPGRQGRMKMVKSKDDNKCNGQKWKEDDADNVDGKKKKK